MPESEQKTKEIKDYYHIIPTLLIILFAVTSFVLYQGNIKSQNSIVEAFTSERLTFVHQGLSGKRIMVQEEYPDLLLDCDNRADYNRYIDTDSRTMTAAQLQEALSLHEACGQYFSNIGELTLGFFEADIEKLRALAASLNEGKTKDNAMQIVTYWENIHALELENSTVYDRLIGIQGEYWEADLNKALGFDSPEEREAAVGALNYEANQRLERQTQIQTELTTLREAEGVFWNATFSTTTGN